MNDGVYNTFIVTQRLICFAQSKRTYETLIAPHIFYKTLVLYEAFGFCREMEVIHS